MLEIPYRTVIPYPFQVVLEQYFDYEHIAHVHPTTLGEYMLVENAGNRIVYDQRWPADRWGRRATSRVVQTYEPPGDIRFDFIAGKHRGTKVLSRLVPHGDGTEVSEQYFIPWLPNWAILRRLIAPMVYRQIERIWREDLDVGVCIGGWPGVPQAASRVDAEEWRRGLAPGQYRLGPIEQFPPGSLKLVSTAGGAVLIAHDEGGLHAVHPICPHTGGPLALGAIRSGCIRCPWHGAAFDLECGKASAGPTRIPLAVYAVKIENGEVMIEA